MIAAARSRPLRRTALLSAALLAATLVTAFPAGPAEADPGPTTLVGLTDDGRRRRRTARAPPSSPATAPRWCSRSFGTDIDDGAPAMSRLFARNRATSTTTAVDLPPRRRHLPQFRGT